MKINFKPLELRKYEADLILLDKESKKMTIKLLGQSTHLAEIPLVKSEAIISSKDFPFESYDRSTFPYLFNSPKTKSKIHFVSGSKFNSHVEGLKTLTVKNAQVVTSFPLSKTFTHITDIEIAFDAFKVMDDSYIDTEMLCLSTTSFKRCSGRKFVLPEWLALTNPNFWTQDSEPRNTLFESMLMAKNERCEGHLCLRLTKTISLKKLFDLSVSDLQKLGKEKVVNLIFTDDTRLLKNPSLIIKSEKRNNQ